MIGQKNSQIPTLRKVCHKAVIADTLGIKFCNNNTSQWFCPSDVVDGDGDEQPCHRVEDQGRHQRLQLQWGRDQAGLVPVQGWSVIIVINYEGGDVSDLPCPSNRLWKTYPYPKPRMRKQSEFHVNIQNTNISLPNKRIPYLKENIRAMRVRL